MVESLLLAARCGYTDIVKCILKADRSILMYEDHSNGSKLWMQAVAEGLTVVFKVYRLS